MLMCWALGNEALGIKPAGKLRALMAQAENDEGDLCEMRDGIATGLELTDDEKKAATDSILIMHEDVRTGVEFCEMLDSTLAQNKCDLVIIDPAFAYLGGEVSAQRDVSFFLRNCLNPVLRRRQCGAIIVHHVNKPPTGKEKSHWQAGDFAYAGSGSVEFANWARGVIVLRSTGSHDIFELRLAKRGKRVGWLQEDGVTPCFTKRIAHAAKEGQIFWREISEDEEALGAPDPDGPKTKIHILPLVPQDRSISKEALISNAQAQGIGVNKTKRFIAALLHDRQLHEWLLPRPGTRPEIHVATFPQPQEIVS